MSRDIIAVKYIILSFVIILPLIFSIAFFTLLERKILASIQRRRGPNVVGVLGFLQPFSDAFKSLFKEIIIPSGCDYYFFLFSPIASLVLSLIPWTVIPFSSNYVFADIDLGVLFILLISSLNVYGVVLAGWSSNSKYALLGGIRSAAQMISYEIPLSLSTIPIIVASESLNLTEIVLKQSNVWYVFPFLPCFMVFIICALAETNRTPFDLPEAEAEIVAGYNVEYSSILFAMFFLAEYGNIIVMSCFTVILFFGGWLLPLPFFNNWFPFIETMVFIFKVIVFMIFFIIVRAILPRYRYDQLMQTTWKIFFPLMFSCSLFFPIMYLIGLRFY